MNIKTRSQRLVTSVVTTTTILWSMGFASIAPLAAQAAVTPNAGDLIRGEATPAVYYFGGDGKRYVFPNEKTYMTWYADFGSVKRLSDADLAAIPLSGVNVTYRPGTKLIKVTTDPKVYAVDKSGALRWVKTEAVAVALWGADWAKSVQDLPDAFFSNYTMGADVNAASDFNVTAVLAGSPTISADKNIAGGAVVTGALSVALGSDTPGAASVANSAADVVFTKLSFSGTGTITSLKVKRTGLSSDARLTAVKLFDGTNQIGNSQTLNSLHKGTFSNLSIAVSGSKTITIAGDIVGGGAGAGEIIKLGVEASGDITLSGGTSPSGTFPIEGNGQTITSVTIGSASLSNGPQHPTTDVNVDADAAAYRFDQVRITAGSTEDIAVKQIVAIRSGTASDSDVKDIKLINDSTGTTLATVAALGTGSKATFDNLNVVVKKGEFIDLSVKATLTGSGSSRTIGFELHDGTSYLVRVVGAQFGFGLTPTSTNFCATAGVGNLACTTQTVKLGTLDVNRAASSPSAGNVPLGGTNVPLVAYDFTVTGEPIRITALNLAVTTSGTITHITNVGFYDAAGSLVAGPKDPVTSGANLSYTDTFILKPGTTTLWVKGNLSSSTTVGATLSVTLPAPSANMTVRGDQSNKVIAAPNLRTTSAVSGNTLTVQGPSLTVVTTGLPKAGSVVANIQDFTFAVVDLDPSGSGEDVKVTDLSITDVLGAGATAGDLLNLEMWGDADNTDTNDVTQRLQTSNSTSVGTGATALKFTLSTPLKVGKNKPSRVYVKADVLSTSTAGVTNTHTVTASAATSTGWTTGSAITATFSGAGQAQTIAASGTLKVELSSVQAANQRGMVLGTSGNVFVQYKLTASTEGINVKKFPVALSTPATLTGAAVVPTTTNPSLGRVSVYVSDSETGTQTLVGAPVSIKANGTASVDITDSPMLVPKDQSKYVTLKADLNSKDDGTSASFVGLGLGDPSGDASAWGANGAASAAAQSYNITASGKDSGSTIAATAINSTANATTGTIQASSNMQVFAGLLTVTRSASQPSGLLGGSNQDLLKFDLTATGDTITINDIEFVYTHNCTNTAATAASTLQSSDKAVAYASWAAGTAWLGDATTTNRSVKVLGTQDSTERGAGGFDTSLTVGSGETKSLVFTGDTSGCTSTNQTFQVSVDAGKAGTRATNTTLSSGIKWQDSKMVAASTTGIDSTVITKTLPVNGPTFSK